MSEKFSTPSKTSADGWKTFLCLLFQALKSVSEFLLLCPFGGVFRFFLLLFLVSSSLLRKNASSEESSAQDSGILDSTEFIRTIIWYNFSFAYRSATKGTCSELKGDGDKFSSHSKCKGIQSESDLNGFSREFCGFTHFIGHYMPRASLSPFGTFVRRVLVELAWLRQLTRKRKRRRRHAHHGCGARRRKRWRCVATSFEVDDFESISGADAFATTKRTQPPSVQAVGVLLDHVQNFSLAESQLVNGLGDVVVNRLRLDILQWRRRVKIEFPSEKRVLQPYGWLMVMEMES